MSEPKPQFFEIEASDQPTRKIAYLEAGKQEGRPSVFWLSGFKSTMEGTKASQLAQWSEAQGWGCLRFDYSGQGLSSGNFADATVSQWLEEAITSFTRLAKGPQVIVGSSMGAWIALLMLRRLASERPKQNEQILGAVLIAPAWDMTETLMWQCFTPEIKEEIEKKGIFHVRSEYDSEPYTITKALIDDGRNLLIAGTPFDPGCPIRILHGQQDPDVPWRHSLDLIDLLQGDDVVLDLIKDGDHRLSRPAELERLFSEVESLGLRAFSI